TGVADVRRGLYHHLADVRRVGQRLLVAGHPGREHRLTEGLSGRTVRMAIERAPVLEHEQGTVGGGRCTHLVALIRWPGGSVGFSSRTVGRPRRNVARTRPGRLIPATGVLTDRETRSVGLIVREVAGQ